MAMRRALELETRVLADDPANFKCCEELLASALGLASLLERVGRTSEAEKIYRAGLEKGQEYLRQFPEAKWCRPGLGRLQNHFGLFLASENRFPDAEAAHRNALDIYEKRGGEFQGQSDRWRRQEQMWTHENLGRLMSRAGRQAEAEKEFGQSIALGEALERDFPGKGYINWLAKDYGNLALLHLLRGRSEEADAAYHSVLERAPRNAAVYNNLSWQLVTCALPAIRGDKRAVLWARKAVELEPKQPSYWNTLGAAYYRAGDWKASIAAFEQSMELGNGSKCCNWLFLAMAHWQLGDKPRAGSWFDKADVWMKKNLPNDVDLNRVRTEAAALMGLDMKHD